jgi:hypothetical protein
MDQKKSGRRAQEKVASVHLFFFFRMFVHLRAKEIIREYIVEFYSAAKVVTVHPAAFQGDF